MKKIALAALGLASLAGSAMAADMAARPIYTKAPPPAPVYSWTGCYVAGGAGYGWSDQEHNTTTVGGALLASDSDTAGKGWFGTVQGGCDYQFSSFLPFLSNSMLIGAFADGDWGSIKGNRMDVIPAGTYIGEEKIDRAWAVGARVGFLPTDRFLTFATAGYTQAHVKDINYALATGGAATFTTSAHNRDGWFLGTGYEYNLSWLPGLFWKTEYRYSDYGSRTDAIVPVAGGAAVANTHGHLYDQTLRSELVYRFNWR